MPKNPIQFQPGLSYTEFHKNYGSETKCRRVLFRLKWPSGFVCPRCQSQQSILLTSRHRYQCVDCRHQTTVTVGTLLEHSKIPVRLWFYAAYLLTQAKNSLSAMSLMRGLGVSYNTAWRIKHKLILAMQLSENKETLSGNIQIDDAYIGGRKRGGKRGRGAGKQPFVAAISLRKNKPYKAKLSIVKSFKQRDITVWAQQHVQPGAVVLSDGMPGFRGVEQASIHHTAIKTTRNRHAQDVVFRWVNTILGNVKRAIDGTYHAIRRPYIDRYLILFQFRFNHRFNLKAMMTTTIKLMVDTQPIRGKKCLA